MKFQHVALKTHLLKDAGKGLYVHSIVDKEVKLTLNPCNARRFKSSEDAGLFSCTMPATPYVFKPVFEQIVLID